MSVTVSSCDETAAEILCVFLRFIIINNCLKKVYFRVKSRAVRIGNIDCNSAKLLRKPLCVPKSGTKKLIID